jgi:drug/metabolite transporter (DMT)-like permease
MIGIVKKDAVTVFTFSLIMTAGLGFYLVSVGRPLDPAIIGLSCLYLLLAVSGPITITEQREYKSNGYVFLKTLPLTDTEIVGSKFVLNTLNLVVSFAVLLISASTIPSEPSLYKTLLVSLMLACLTAWVMSGLWYWGIFSLGISRMIKVVWGFFLLFVTGGIVFLEFAVFRETIDITVLRGIMTGLNWKVWVVLAMCAASFYIQMFRLSLKAARLKYS